MVSEMNVENPNIIDDYNVAINNVETEIDVSDLVSVVNIDHKDDMFKLFENHKSDGNGTFETDN